MEPWYKIATPRKEVREGRSFNPDEFAIHLEQVVAKTAPEDYRDPKLFFSRTCFTRALREHAGMVLRRLAGETANTAPVMTLVTQFGGGKTHTLTALYHIAKTGEAASELPGVAELLEAAGLSVAPAARVAVFVGNAWDPQDGCETPWIDIAYQLAGEKGVQELGPEATTVPPGTDALSRVFKAAGGPVLLLFDEVLNFLNRHRKMADSFYAFLQNLTVATTATTQGAAMISLPRSQVEMTDWDMQWQEKITKVVRRVAKDLIANDETEIAEVVRQRLFEDLGSERTRKNVAKVYADWCFDRRAQLPPEWTAVNSTLTEAKARDHLRTRFEACYPFHPATLSVFQRKWQTLPQYQQTRGTLAMLAQWVSWAYQTGFKEARREPLITLGSAPLDAPGFHSIVLGQLGEARLAAAIDTDISGQQSHARALDADTQGALRGIHRRIGTGILFESSGGQVDKVAHLPELRFAVGEPDVDTTSIDNAALALERKSYYIRPVGSDGFRIGHNPTLKKVVNDRRASLDEATEIVPAMKALIRKEFERGAAIPVVHFPNDGAAIQDSPKLTLIDADPEMEWPGSEGFRQQIGEWTKQKGDSPRLYPGALVWCLRKQGRELRDKVELWLAWSRVGKEIADGTLGSDLDRSERSDIQTRVKDAEQAAKDEVWAEYRFVVISDTQESDGLKVIDLGAGHSSGNETLCGRVIGALKSQALLSESVGSGYIERNWPNAFREPGAWPLPSLRQSFLNGSLTRLVDPDVVLTTKIAGFVVNGDFGLASGQRTDGTYDHLWYKELISPDEVAFDSGVFLLSKARAEALRMEPEGGGKPEPSPVPTPGPEPAPEPDVEPPQGGKVRSIRVVGAVPPEIWNRLGTRILPKLRSGSDLRIGVDFVVNVDGLRADSLITDLKQILDELGLSDQVRVE